VASGFIVLADGRCFAPRWFMYDSVLRVVAEQLTDSPQAQELRLWVLSLLPGPTDIKDIGYGPWVRGSDHEIIPRHLDVRNLTLENQKLFHRAVRLAREAASHEPPKGPVGMDECLVALADMVARADYGEPPLSRSDWQEVVPSDGKKAGPGW